MALSRLGLQYRHGISLCTRGIIPIRALSTTCRLSADAKAETPAVTAPPSRTSLSQFLHDKTGVTGAWVLGVGLASVAISKELYVFNHVFVEGVALGLVVYALSRRLGKPISDALEADIEGFRTALYDHRNKEVQSLEQAVKEELDMENVLACRHEIFKIKHENNAMQLEAEYRRRLSDMYSAVKRRLDYHVEVEELQKRFEREQIVDWLEAEVRKGIVGKEDESITQCIANLKTMPH